MDKNEKNNNKVILIGVILMALVFCFTLFRSELGKNKTTGETSQKKALNYSRITTANLKDKLKNKEAIQIIDIRSPEDYRSEHMIDSINADSKDSISGIPQGKTIILVGYSDSKDENYSEIIDYLKSKKYANVFILTGGIDSWKNIGGNTISSGNPLSFSDNSKVIYATPDDLKKLVDNEIYPKFIIDVREKQLFDNGHIHGAVNIFLDDLEKSSDKISSGKEIFVYGDDEIQGFQAGVRLYDLNFFTVKVLKGGLASWKEKGFPLEK